MTERLSKLAPSELNPEQAALYRSISGGVRGKDKRATLMDTEGNLIGPFNAMLHMPIVGEALQGLGTALRYQGSLSARIRELVTLAVAAHWDSSFERYAHEPLARKQGLTSEQIACIESGQTVFQLSVEEDTALQVARKLLDSKDLNDEEYASAVRELGEQSLIEITTLIGYYSLLALQLRVFRVTAPTTNDSETRAH